MHKLKNNNNNNMIIGHDNNSRFLNPSFSSTLLDQIYRSIDDQGEARSPEMRFYRETTTTTTTKKKQNSKWTETKLEDNDNNSKRRHNKRVSESVAVGSRDHVDQDVMLFSSASFSSDSCSSSGGFSSSDTESLYGTRSRASCFAPLKPKPVRTSMSEEQGHHRRFNSFRHDSNTQLRLGIATADDYNEASLIKSKSRALKIYNNLKKVKQPISPGGKITSFLNSIFANSKKTSTTSATKTSTTTTKSYPSKRDRVFELDGAIVSHKSVQAPACSSASSFSRSCLSNANSSDREKLYNGMKRTVRFDFRPEHKRVCELDEGNKVPTTAATTWNKINGKSPMKSTVVEKSKVVEEAAREFLEEYRRNNNQKKKKNDLVLKDLNLPVSIKINANNEDDDDEDVASCASSDLFELDHLAVFGSDRYYCEELPVYETTHVGTNRAIANGLIV